MNGIHPKVPIISIIDCIITNYFNMGMRMSAVGVGYHTHLSTTHSDKHLLNTEIQI